MGDVERHTLTHFKERLVCMLCDSSFTRPEHLRRHLKSVHARDVRQNQLLACSICSVKIGSNSIDAHLVECIKAVVFRRLAKSDDKQEEQINQNDQSLDTNTKVEDQCVLSARPRCPVAIETGDRTALLPAVTVPATETGDLRFTEDKQLNYARELDNNHAREFSVQPNSEIIFSPTSGIRPQSATPDRRSRKKIMAATGTAQESEATLSLLSAMASSPMPISTPEDPASPQYPMATSQNDTVPKAMASTLR